MTTALGLLAGFPGIIPFDFGNRNGRYIRSPIWAVDANSAPAKSARYLRTSIAAISGRPLMLGLTVSATSILRLCRPISKLLLS
jgi:hypothetical protein